MRRIAAVALYVLLTGSAAHAQDATCDLTFGNASALSASVDLARIADIGGAGSQHSFFVRRYSDLTGADICALPDRVHSIARSLALPARQTHGAALLPTDLRVHINTGYPRDWNDGALWSARGLSSSVTTGASFRWGRLEAALVPVITAQQNSRYDTQPYPDAAYSRYAHRWHGRFIDLPQRFGNDAIGTLDAGQSFVRVSGGGWRGGISTENIVWGPARRNPLLLSGTSQGFAHAFIETSRPHDAWLGDAELQLFFGRLTESDYFDFDTSNDHRAMTGLVGTLRPRGLDGLYIGAGYLHTQTWNDATGLGDLVTAPFSGARHDSVGLPRDLRLFGLFARWVAAPGGLEIYGEWARQDTWKQWFRLLNPVDAAQAYTLGLQKFVRRGDTGIRFSAEVSHVSDALSHRDLGRGLITYYISPAVTQGHTHRGQLLGAPIGPGSEAQFIGTDVFWRYGRSSFSIERVRYDDDAYYAVWASVHGPHGHDTELSFRAGHMWTSGPLAIDGEVGYSFRYNRELLGLHHSNHPGFPYRRDTNVGIRLTGRWTPPQR